MNGDWLDVINFALVCMGLGGMFAVVLLAFAQRRAEKRAWKRFHEKWGTTRVEK